MAVLVNWSDNTFNVVTQFDLLPPLENNELAAWVHDFNLICRIKEFIDENNILIIWTKDSSENILSASDVCATLESKKYFSVMTKRGEEKFVSLDSWPTMSKARKQREYYIKCKGGRTIISYRT